MYKFIRNEPARSNEGNREEPDSATVYNFSSITVYPTIVNIVENCVNSNLTMSITVVLSILY